MQQLDELAAAQPHQPAGEFYSKREWSVYCAGYYMALQVMAKVLVAAERRWRFYVRERRAAAKADRAKSGAA